MMKRFCSAKCRQNRYASENREKCYEKSRNWAKKHPGYLGPKRQAISDEIKNIKESTPCFDCRNRFPYCCMDFDHVRGFKSKEIGSMVASSTDIESIRKEIMKCELVCANCHRIRTTKRKSSGWTGRAIKNDETPKSLVK